MKFTDNFKEIKMDARKAKEILDKRYRKQNEYIANKYSRISVVVEKGMKERIRMVAESGGETLNGYIKRLIEEDLAKHEEASQ